MPMVVHVRAGSGGGKEQKQSRRHLSTMPYKPCKQGNLPTASTSPIFWNKISFSHSPISLRTTRQKPMRLRVTRYPRLGLRARQEISAAHSTCDTAEVDLATAFGRCTYLDCDVSQGFDFSYPLYCWTVIIGGSQSYLLLHCSREFLSVYGLIIRCAGEHLKDTCQYLSRLLGGLSVLIPHHKVCINSIVVHADN